MKFNLKHLIIIVSFIVLTINFDSFAQRTIPTVPLDTLLANNVNFFNWPNQNGQPKGGINLNSIMQNLGYSPSNRSINDYPYDFHNDSVTVSILKFNSNIDAQATFLMSGYFRSYYNPNDTISFNNSYGDVSKNIFRETKNSENFIKATKSNYFIVVRSIIDSTTAINVINSICTEIGNLPGLSSIEASGTRPFFSEIIYPDSLIRDWAATTNIKHEFRVLINNPEEFLKASALGTIPNVMFNAINMIGIKDTDSDTIRFATSTLSSSTFTSDLDSLKIEIGVINQRGEGVDTTFWITRRKP